MKQKLTMMLIGMIALLFAIPAISNAGSAKKISTNKRSWIGVAVQDVTPKFAREKELKIKEGAYVNEVVDDSPADSSGIKEGDVITEFNTTRIEEANDLVEAVREAKVGDKVSVSLMRKDAKKIISLVVGTLPKRTGHFTFDININKVLPRMMMFGAHDGAEGMKLMKLNKQLGKYFEAPNGKGLLVQEVKKNSNAEKAGIVAGDVMYKINGELVEDIGDLNSAIEDIDSGKKIDVELIRKGAKKTVALEISEKKDNKFMFRFNDHGMNMMPPSGLRCDDDSDCDECEPMNIQREDSAPDVDKKIEKKIIIN